jgi:hypothetical protein
MNAKKSYHNPALESTPKFSRRLTAYTLSPNDLRVISRCKKWPGKAQYDYSKRIVAGVSR